MKEKILAKFKAKFPDVTLSNKRLDELADRLTKKVTDESEIDAKLDDMNDLHPFAEIQKADDSVRDWKAKLKNAGKPETNSNQSSSTAQNTDTTPQADEPEWKKELAEMKQALANFQKERSQQTISEQVKAHDKLKGIPASFLKGRALPEKPEDIDAYAEGIVTDYAAFKQELANEGFAQSTRPGSGNGTTPAKGAVSPEVKAFAEKNLKKQETN